MSTTDFDANAELHPTASRQDPASPTGIGAPDLGLGAPPDLSTAQESATAITTWITQEAHTGPPPFSVAEPVGRPTDQSQLEPSSKQGTHGGASNGEPSEPYGEGQVIGHRVDPRDTKAGDRLQFLIDSFFLRRSDIDNADQLPEDLTAIRMRGTLRADWDTRAGWNLEDIRLYDHRTGRELTGHGNRVHLPAYQTDHATDPLRLATPDTPVGESTHAPGPNTAVTPSPTEAVKTADHDARQDLPRPAANASGGHSLAALPEAKTGPHSRFPMVADKLAILEAARFRMLTAANSTDGSQPASPVISFRHDGNTDGPFADADTVDQLVADGLLTYSNSGTIDPTPQGEAHENELRAQGRPEPAIGDRVLVHALGRVGIVCGYLKTPQGLRNAELVIDMEGWPHGWSTEMLPLALTVLETGAVDPAEAADLYRDKKTVEVSEFHRTEAARMVRKNKLTPEQHAKVADVVAWNLATLDPIGTKNLIDKYHIYVVDKNTHPKLREKYTDGITTPGKKTIHISNEVFTGKVDLLDVLTHEIGHAVATESLREVFEIMARIRGLTNEFATSKPAQNPDHIAHKISLYATISQDEFRAEAYKTYVLGAPAAPAYRHGAVLVDSLRATRETQELAQLSKNPTDDHEGIASPALSHSLDPALPLSDASQPPKPPPAVEAPAAGTSTAPTPPPQAHATSEDTNHDNETDTRSSMANSSFTTAPITPETQTVSQAGNRQSREASAPDEGGKDTSVDSPTGDREPAFAPAEVAPQPETSTNAEDDSAKTIPGTPPERESPHPVDPHSLADREWDEIVDGYLYRFRQTKLKYGSIGVCRYPSSADPYWLRNLAAAQAWSSKDAKHRARTEALRSAHPLLDGPHPLSAVPVVEKLDEDYWRVIILGEENRIRAVGDGYDIDEVGVAPRPYPVGRDSSNWDGALHMVRSWALDRVLPEKAAGPEVEVSPALLTARGVDRTDTDCWNCVYGNPAWNRKKRKILVNLGEPGVDAVLCVPHATGALVPGNIVQDIAAAFGEQKWDAQKRVYQLVWEQVTARETLPPLTERIAMMAVQAAADQTTDSDGADLNHQVETRAFKNHNARIREQSDAASDVATDEYGRPYANGFRPAVYEWDGWTCANCAACGTGAACADCDDCTAFAAPYPPHWARDWQEGDPERGVEIFGGPGGMSAGRELVDDSGDWVLIEWNRDAAATARAAGHWVVEADVRTLDPRHPALRGTKRFHGSPPCQTLSDAGKRTGWNEAEIGELQSIMWQASEAFGFLEVDDLCSLYGGPHHYFGDVIEGIDADDWDEDYCGGGHLPPGMTPAQFREWAAEAVSDDRTALMAEMLIWPMCMVQIGAPLVSVTMEQSANLLKKSPALAEAIQSEFTSMEGFGWMWCSWQIEDAAKYGAATRRERAVMVAMRYVKPRYAEHVDSAAAEREIWAHVLKRTGELPDWIPDLSQRIDPYQGRPALPVVTMADALNLPDDWWADTRGKRKINPKTGAPLGGGSFPLNDVGQCVTAPWYGIKFRPADVPQGEGTEKITLPDLGTLVGFTRDYPWTYIPSRAGAKGIRNIAQMIADAVSPFMGAAISAAVQGKDWYWVAIDYQKKVYRLAPTAERIAPPAELALPASHTADEVHAAHTPAKQGNHVQATAPLTPPILTKQESSHTQTAVPLTAPTNGDQIRHDLQAPHAAPTLPTVGDDEPASAERADQRPIVPDNPDALPRDSAGATNRESKVGATTASAAERPQNFGGTSLTNSTDVLFAVEQMIDLVDMVRTFNRPDGREEWLNSQPRDLAGHHGHRQDSGVEVVDSIQSTSLGLEHHVESPTGNREGIVPWHSIADYVESVLTPDLSRRLLLEPPSLAGSRMTEREWAWRMLWNDKPLRRITVPASVDTATAVTLEGSAADGGRQRPSRILSTFPSRVDMPRRDADTSFPPASDQGSPEDTLPPARSDASPILPESDRATDSLPLDHEIARVLGQHYPSHQDRRAGAGYRIAMVAGRCRVTWADADGADRWDEMPPDITRVLSEAGYAVAPTIFRPVLVVDRVPAEPVDSRYVVQYNPTSLGSEANVIRDRLFGMTVASFYYDESAARDEALRLNNGGVVAVPQLVSVGTTDQPERSKPVPDNPSEQASKARGADASPSTVVETSTAQPFASGASIGRGGASPSGRNDSAAIEIPPEPDKSGSQQRPARNGTPVPTAEAQPSAPGTPLADEGHSPAPLPDPRGPKNATAARGDATATPIDSATAPAADADWDRDSHSEPDAASANPKQVITVPEDASPSTAAPDLAGISSLFPPPPGVQAPADTSAVDGPDISSRIRLPDGGNT